MKANNIIYNGKLIIILAVWVCLVPTQASAKTEVKANAKTEVKANTTANNANIKAEAEKAIADAEKSLKKASSVDGQWRDSGKILKAASKALKAGDYVAAIKKANTANRQGKLGYQQAVEQLVVKMPPYWK